MEVWTLNWTKLEQLTNEAATNLDNDIPGVFRLSYKHKDDKYYVFFVGQSTSIKEYFLAYYEDGVIDNVCVKNHISSGNCYFRYAQISNEEVRNATEKQAYNLYKPECNKVQPQGRDDIQVNLS